MVRIVLRSIAAIVAGFVLVVALSVGADAVLVLLGAAGTTARTTGSGVLAIMLAYVFVFAAAGAYLTARLAPRRPLAHALALGAIGLALGALAAAVSWGSAPVWYHTIALAQVLPASWLGASFRTRAAS